MLQLLLLVLLLHMAACGGPCCVWQARDAVIQMVLSVYNAKQPPAAVARCQGYLKRQMTAADKRAKIERHEPRPTARP
jgi:hypothetical protein